MKLKDVEIGGRYVAKVSGKLQTVRIVRKRFSHDVKGNLRQRFEAVNERTGRTITIRSPSRLRYRVDSDTQERGNGTSD